MTKGGIINTHYNIIDTLRTFIPSNTWNKMVSEVQKFLNLSTYDFVNAEGELVFTSISALAHNTDIQMAIPYDMPVRYTICEAIIWGYYNGDYGLT